MFVPVIESITCNTLEDRPIGRNEDLRIGGNGRPERAGVVSAAGGYFSGLTVEGTNHVGPIRAGHEQLSVPGEPVQLEAQHVINSYHGLAFAGRQGINVQQMVVASGFRLIINIQLTRTSAFSMNARIPTPHVICRRISKAKTPVAVIPPAAASDNQHHKPGPEATANPAAWRNRRGFPTEEQPGHDTGKVRRTSWRVVCAGGYFAAGFHGMVEVGKIKEKAARKLKEQARGSTATGCCR